MHHIISGCLIDTKSLQLYQDHFTAKNWPTFGFSYLSRFLQYLSFYSTDFAQILMEQYLFSFFFAVVKTASFYLYLFRKGSKNKMTHQKSFLQQPPISSKKLQNSIKKFFANRIFRFLLECVQE